MDDPTVRHVMWMVEQLADQKWQQGFDIGFMLGAACVIAGLLLRAWWDRDPDPKPQQAPDAQPGAPT